MELGARLHDYLLGPGGEGVLAAYLIAGDNGAGADAPGEGPRVVLLLDRPTFPGRADRGDEAERQGHELLQVLRRDHVEVTVLNDLPPAEARELIKRGRRFLVRGDDTVQSFERDVLLRAADVAPFARRARRRLMEYLRS